MYPDRAESDRAIEAQGADEPFQNVILRPLAGPAVGAVHCTALLTPTPSTVALLTQPHWQGWPWVLALRKWYALPYEPY